MREVAVRDLRPGMALPRPLRSARGELLLQADVPLTSRHIDLLRLRGFNTVFVQDFDTSDVEIQDVISDDVRAKATFHLTQLYDVLESAARQFHGAPNDRLVAEVRTSGISRLVREHPAYHRLEQTLDAIVDDVLSADVLIGLNTVRTVEPSWFVHAIDTTAVAVALARRLRFRGTQLRRVARGSLLHDVGMVLLDRDLIERPGPLTEVERARIRLHPQLGFELLQQLRPHEFLANHVAYQHHERQDGTGYPRGLRGHNQVHRTLLSPDRGASGRITIEAEIVAVADVYVALTGGRPHRSALTPEQAMRKLWRLAGTHLNREITNHLIAMLPVYPLGATVQVKTGQYARYRGIVSRLHRDCRHRPTVRLLFNNWLERIDPIEIDLRGTRDLIECVPAAPPDSASAKLRARALRELRPAA